MSSNRGHKKRLGSAYLLKSVAEQREIFAERKTLGIIIRLSTQMKSNVEIRNHFEGKYLEGEKFPTQKGSAAVPVPKQ